MSHRGDKAATLGQMKPSNPKADVGQSNNARPLKEGKWELTAIDVAGLGDEWHADQEFQDLELAVPDAEFDRKNELETKYFESYAIGNYDRPPELDFEMHDQISAYAGCCAVSSESQKPHMDESIVIGEKLDSPDEIVQRPVSSIGALSPEFSAPDQKSKKKRLHSTRDELDSFAAEDHDFDPSSPSRRSRHMQHRRRSSVRAPVAPNQFPPLNYAHDCDSTRFEKVAPVTEPDSSESTAHQFPCASSTTQQFPQAHVPTPLTQTPTPRADGSTYCLGRRARTRAPCRNLALLPHNQMQSRYCAQHVSLETPPIYRICDAFSTGSPAADAVSEVEQKVFFVFFMLLGSNLLQRGRRACPEVIPIDLPRCYKHMQQHLVEFSEPSRLTSLLEKATNYREASYSYCQTQMILRAQSTKSRRRGMRARLSADMTLFGGTDCYPSAKCWLFCACVFVFA